MARIRQLKPEFWTDDKVAGLSRDARLLFLGLLTEADDDGRLVDSPKLLAGSLFPFDDDVTPKKLTAWLQEIIRLGLVRKYGSGAASYLYIANFKKHQKIAHPRRSSLPDPDKEPPNAGGTRADGPRDALAPPGERAPDLGVKGSRGQGVKGVGVVEDSSSNHHVGPAPGGEEEELQSKELTAARLVAERRLTLRAGPPLTNATSWLRSVRAEVLRDHGAELHQLAQQGMHPKAMADRIQPPATSPYPTAGEHLEPVHDLDDAGFAVPRRSA